MGRSLRNAARHLFTLQHPIGCRCFGKNLRALSGQLYQLSCRAPHAAYANTAPAWSPSGDRQARRSRSRRPSSAGCSGSRLGARSVEPDGYRRCRGGAVGNWRSDSGAMLLAKQGASTRGTCVSGYQLHRKFGHVGRSKRSFHGRDAKSATLIASQPQRNIHRHENSHIPFASC